MDHRHRRTTFAIGSVLILGLAGSCRAFDEKLLDGAVEDSGASCPLNRPPERPTVGDDDDGETYFFALRELLIDQRPDAWQSIGYDLDGRCTTAANPDVECRPPTSSAPPELDGVDGTDNVLGHQVLPLVLVAMGGIQEELQAYQTEGLGVTLLQIRGWNGEDDDPRVEAVLSQSVFATTRRPDRVDSYSVAGRMLTINGEAGWPMAGWAGADFWYADSANYLAGDPEQPRTRDDNAYIADRTLVMRVPDRFPIAFRGDMRSSQFLLTNSTFTAKISADDSVIEEGTLAGRFAVLDILDTVPALGVCVGSDDYRAFARLLELAADLRLVAGSGGPGVSCDALSVGLRYQQGTRATLGGVVDTLPLMNPCIDGGIQPDGGPDGGPRDGGPGDGGPGDGGVMDGGFDGGVPMGDGGDFDGG